MLALKNHVKKKQSHHWEGTGECNTCEAPSWCSLNWARLLMLYLWTGTRSSFPEFHDNTSSECLWAPPENIWYDENLQYCSILFVWCFDVLNLQIKRTVFQSHTNMHKVWDHKCMKWMSYYNEERTFTCIIWNEQMSIAVRADLHSVCT
jgi:hypothetical protein